MASGLFPLVGPPDRFGAVSRASVNPDKAEGLGMASHFIQTRSGRALLHLAAALRAGHWSWHFAGIIRELGQSRMRGARAARLPRGREGEGC
jgi:hypothetical protein